MAFDIRHSFYEAPVNLALRDLIYPGDVVMDVGANVGYLTLIMSHLVGRFGKVVAFEASRDVLPELAANVASSRIQNVHQESLAIAAKDGEVSFATHPDFPQGGRIEDVSDASLGFIQTVVPARSLDSYCEEFNLCPSVIKMDIEGGEADALAGASALIDAARPLFILEQHEKDGLGCIQFLDERGYDAVSLKTFRRVSANVGITSGSVDDVLFYPRERLAPELYVRSMFGESRESEGFAWEGDTLVSAPLTLAAGRYEVVFNWDRRAPFEMYQELLIDGSPDVRNHGNSEWLHPNYRSTVIGLPNGATIQASIRVFGDPNDFEFKSISVREILPRHPFRPGAWS